MFKFRKIEFKNHYILGNLVLDFCDQNGRAADTVIIAGENGAGKSTVLNELFSIASNYIAGEIELEYEEDGAIYHIIASSQEDHVKRFGGSRNSFVISDTRNNSMNPLISWGANTAGQHRIADNPFTGIYSDVEINFNTSSISSVTSMTLDSSEDSYRSSPDFPNKIKQLLVDIQAMDDADIADAVRQNPDKSRNELEIEERMPRFTRAFNQILGDLAFKKVESLPGQKAILFTKHGSDIRLENLSSGEKQIIFRGCFLLKDKDALRGAFVFIDEPEISLHPSWQMKVMDFYKSIFTNSEGAQTSQIFAVTHSPFIIHNDSRKNDKVIVLQRNDNGAIVAIDKPEYYKCTSTEAVEDAFDVHDFYTDQPTVFLEGRTDEKYFQKALEVFQITVPFRFRWIGYLDENGEEKNTGYTALNKAFPFLVSRNLPQISVCVYDCDTNKGFTKEKNVIAFSLDKYENTKNITAGIENALEFGGIDIEPYRKYKIVLDPTSGLEKQIPEFDKMACCDYICSLDTEQLKPVFIHLKEIIESKLIPIFEADQTEPS